MNAARHEKESTAGKRERGTLLGQLEHAIAPTEPEYTIEAIHIRAETVTAVREAVLHACLPPRWEINEPTTTATEPRKAEKGPG